MLLLGINQNVDSLWRWYGEVGHLLSHAEGTVDVLRLCAQIWTGEKAASVACTMFHHLSMWPKACSEMQCSNCLLDS